ncbi:MAG: DUF2179 domain-containing protein [Geothermobacteraceae bacterium]
MSASLPLILAAVFCARIIDVSIGTLRIIFLTRGLKLLASCLGFAESLIWILAISQVMRQVDNWLAYVAFAAGFACGNFVGIMLEEKIALGTLIVRILTRHLGDDLVRALRAQGFGVTWIDAHGEEGPVTAIFTIVRRKRLADVINLIRHHNPNAVYTVEDVRFASAAFTGLGTTRRPVVERRPFRLRK